MIHGVRVKNLLQIVDQRGKVMRFMRSDDPDFAKFGEVYFSTVHKGVVKGWHLHKEMTLNYAVPSGTIKLVLYDDRPDSPTKGEVNEFVMGESAQAGHYCRVTVPPGVWNAFQGISNGDSIVCNCATHVHDPNEIVRLHPSDLRIPYFWFGARGGI